MGHDYDFDNVESLEFVSVDSPMVFDGTNYIATDERLLSDDQSFVMVVDFAFDSDCATEGKLMSCYYGTGVALEYSTNPMLRWGSSAQVTCATATNRELLVVRKVAGDPNLYYYISDKGSDEIITGTYANTIPIQHDARLCFGANLQPDGYVDDYAKGTVYWAKLWKADLGENICSKLAAWPRQTITMQAVGTAEHAFRTFKLCDTGLYSNCCFMMTDLLDITHEMNPTATNEGGWAACSMRTWLNLRVLAGLPDQWQMIVKKVEVKSSTGQKSTDLTTSEDYIWLPSVKDVGYKTTTSPYAGESSGTFNVYATGSNRIKYRNGVVSPWYTRSPNCESTVGPNYFAQFNASLTSLYYSASNVKQGVCFGFCI
jgi:hypothetical protein